MDRAFASRLEDDLASMLASLSTHSTSSPDRRRSNSAPVTTHTRQTSTATVRTTAGVTGKGERPLHEPPKPSGTSPAGDARDRDLRAAKARYLEETRREIKMKKTQRRDRKTTCGQCGSKAAKGDRLQMCSRCRAENYCSAECQRAHHYSGHKEECRNLEHPPFAKLLDASTRPDVLWPDSPIFGSGKNDGVGIWVTVNGTYATNLLDLAVQPADPRCSDAPLSGSPSARRWAGLGGTRSMTSIDTMRYLGCTLMGFRVLVQNRRPDGRAVVVVGSDTALRASALLKANMLPTDPTPAEIPQSENRPETIVLRPWKDWLGTARIAVLEINGVAMPVGRFVGGEYAPPEKPVGEPWNRVKDWERGVVALGRGDYVVLSVQYHIGDGIRWKTYPHLLLKTESIMSGYLLCNTRSTEPDWLRALDREVHARQLLDKQRDAIIAHWDFPYIMEYYGPYFEGGLNAFTQQRKSALVKTKTDVAMMTMPQQLRERMRQAGPEHNAQIRKELKEVGFDLDEMLKHLGVE